MSNENETKTKTISNKGGARKGAGRKPTGNKKISISLYFKPDVVIKIGGSEELRNFIYKLINENHETNLH